MDLKQIKELMVAMGRTGTKRLLIKKENFELQLEKEEVPVHYDESSLDHAEMAQRRTDLALSKGNISITKAVGKDIPPALHPPTDHPHSIPVKEEGTFVTSPMVGTFYSSPGPDEPSFVKPGDKVEKDTVVCIVEAMKVMNEVKAGISGIIAEVLVESGHPVEFKSKLFKII